MEWIWLAKWFGGIEWTIPTIGTAIAGTVGFIATCYKLYDRWSTREERRLKLLHQYLDKEEEDITARRKLVLSSIERSRYQHLDTSGLDVGAEIDGILSFIERGLFDQAENEFRALATRISSKQALVAKHTEDLKLHLATVNVMLAAICDRTSKAKEGLDFVSAALQTDANDKDALKYAGQLYVKCGDSGNAIASFTRLKQRATGAENDIYRANAWEGIALTHLQADPPDYVQALSSFENALQNLHKLAPANKDAFSEGRINTKMADIYVANGAEEERQAALNHYKRGINNFKLADRGVAQDEVRRIQQKIRELENRKERA